MKYNNSSMLRETLIRHAPKVLAESVLDPVHYSRCPEVFDSNEMMHPKAKKQIVDIFTKWAKDKDIEIVRFRMIGSLSGFQYTDYSDVDIEATIRYDKDIRNISTILPNGNNLEGTAHPINYYLVNLNTDSEPDEQFAENIYDITNNKWIKKSDKQNVRIPIGYVQSVSRFFSDPFDLALSQFNRLKIKYEDYSHIDIKKVDISKDEFNDRVEDLDYDLRTVLDTMSLGLSLLRGFQDDAFHGGNQFKVNINYMSDDPRFSMNNLIYKQLDRLGYQEKMKESIKEARELINKVSKLKITD